MTYIDRIKELRRAQGLTQQQVADAIGVGRTSYTNKEAGRQAISADELIRMSELFGVSLDELTGRKPLSVPGPTKYQVYEEMQWKRTA